MKINVYGTKTCPYCIKLKHWLDINSVKYDYYDVNTNPIAAQNMMRLSKRDIVPFSTVEFDDGKVEYISGFDEESFSLALKLK